MLLGGLIPRSDFSQLVHLVNARAHYMQHKAEAAAQNKAICSVYFIYIHFINTQKHDHADHEQEHEELPFQSINGSIVYLLNSLQLAELNLSKQTDFHYTAYQSPFYLLGFLSTTVHPPSIY